MKKIPNFSASNYFDPSSLLTDRLKVYDIRSIEFCRNESIMFIGGNAGEHLQVLNKKIKTASGNKLIPQIIDRNSHSKEWGTFFGVEGRPGAPFCRPLERGHFDF